MSNSQFQTYLGFFSLLLLSGCSSHSLMGSGNEVKAVEGGLCPVATQVTNRAYAREMLLGSWQGVKDMSGKERYQWLTHHYADGTYRSVFREPDQTGDVEDKVEVGYWGVSGMVRFLLFRGWETPSGFIASPPDEPTYYDAFLIQRIDEDQILYCNLETGERFQAVRVAHEAEFPPLSSHDIKP